MLGFLPPGESFSVAQYTAMAKKIILDIHARGALPILAGGTGLYIDSLAQNIDFGEDPADASIRRELRKRLELEGPEALHGELAKIDPEAAAALHPNNTGRVIRALEVYSLTGKTISERKAMSRRNPGPFAPVYIGISFREREKLYERVNKRVDKMLEAGLLDEARANLPPRDSTAGQAIGHKELMPYLEGKISLDEALETLKTETRRYAKRQLTWFRRNPDMNWFFRDDFSDESQFSAAVIDFLKKRI